MKIKIGSNETNPATFDYKYIKLNYGIYQHVQETSDRLVISTPAGVFLCHGVSSSTPWFGPIGTIDGGWGNMMYIKSDKILTLSN